MRDPRASRSMATLRGMIVPGAGWQDREREPWSSPKLLLVCGEAVGSPGNSEIPSWLNGSATRRKTLSAQLRVVPAGDGLNAQQKGSETDADFSLTNIFCSHSGKGESF